MALERVRLDAMIAGLVFIAGMRRSEVSVLRWGDVADAADGILVTVRRGKTNQEGETKDVRFVKAGVGRALRTLRAATSPAPDDQGVPLSPQMVGLRFAGRGQVPPGSSAVTVHSGRIGLVSEPRASSGRRESLTTLNVPAREQPGAAGRMTSEAGRRPVPARHKCDFRWGGSGYDALSQRRRTNCREADRRSCERPAAVARRIEAWGCWRSGAAESRSRGWPLLRATVLPVACRRVGSMVLPPSEP